jgi:hypothetical protein
MVVLAGDEVEEALRAVYGHYSEAERMAGTANGTDLPLVFEVQELIYRGLLPPDVWDTAEPILTLREIAMAPRSQISSQVATDIARATQAIILRIQSLGIKFHASRVPLAWLRHDGDYVDDSSSASSREHVIEVEREHDPQVGDLAPADDGEIVDGDRLGSPLLRAPVASEASRWELRPRPGVQEPTDSQP